jgi:CheY-like chemotaxis protein
MDLNYGDHVCVSPWSGQSVNVLVVDDDRVDTLAVRRSFRKLNITNPIIAAKDGIEALEHLRGENGHQKMRSPLVLLDLNMPRMGGIEFLGEIRRDPLLRRTLVFVMTTSSAAEDQARAYDRNVAGYILKYRAGECFEDAIAMLKKYWETVEFPR